MPECTFCKNHFEEYLDYTFCKNCGGKLKVDSSITARLDIIQKKINNEPLNAALYHELGNLLLENNAVNLALEQFHKSLAIETGNLDTYIKISEANIKLDKIKEAESFLEKAFQIDKTNLNIHHELIRLYFKNKNWDKAIHACLNYLNKEDDYGIRLILARIYQEKGNYKDAIIAYEQVLSIKEDSTESLEELSRIYEHENKYDKFIEIQEKLLILNPNSNNIVNLIRAYLFSSETKKALEIINKFENQIEPELLRFYKGIALLLSGDEKNALAIFSDLDFSLQIVKLTKKEKELILNLLMNSGKLKFNDKLYNDSLKFFNYAKEVNPKSEVIINNIALIHYELGLQCMKEEKWDDAILEFQNSIKNGKKDAENKLAEIHANRGNEYFNKNKLQESYNSYQKATKFDPKNEEYQEHLIKISSLMSGSRKRKTRNIVVIAIAIILFASIIYVFFHGNIQVTVEPIEAAISIHSIINDKPDIKISPDSSFGNISLNWLKRGEYILVLESPGYEKYEERISVGNGMTTNREVNLKPEYGSLSIKTTPTGAEVIINEKSYGTTPLIIDSLLAKGQEIILKRKHYLKKILHKKINKNVTVTLNVSLDPLQRFKQKDIFRQFSKDFPRNNNLSNSYSIFKKYVIGAEEIVDIHDIASFTGSFYEINKIDLFDKDVNNIGNLKFLDDDNFIYVIWFKNKPWKIYKYNISDRSSNELLSDEGTIYIQDNGSVIIHNNNNDNLYLFDLVNKTKTNFYLDTGNWARDFSISYDNRYLSFVNLNKESHGQIWFYDKTNNTKRLVASPNRNEKASYGNPIFSNFENILFITKYPFYKKSEVIKYDINTGKKNNFFSARKISYRHFKVEEDFMVCCTYDEKYKSKINILA